ncbi:MAG: hypothetical protein Q4F11_10005, partial [Eubacteriales bacterium]|nr:hypothetical protein [Eubacteriales bacterium]
MKSNRNIDDLKKLYEEIPVPKDLESKTMQSISQAKRRSAKKKYRVLYIMAKAAGAAAAVILTFIILVNSNRDIAAAMERIVVLDRLVDAVTFKAYRDTQHDGRVEASVDIPKIDESIAGTAVDELNNRIEEYTGEIISQYEEWAAQSQGSNYKVNTDYMVVTDSRFLFSLRFDTSQIMAGSNVQTKIFHLDKEKDKIIILKDI